MFSREIFTLVAAFRFSPQNIYAFIYFYLCALHGNERRLTNEIVLLVRGIFRPGRHRTSNPDGHERQHDDDDHAYHDIHTSLGRLTVSFCAA